MAIDIVINETIDLVDITVNPNIIEVNVTRTSGGGGGSQTLAQTLALGNTTGGENILVNNADAIELENTSLLKKGTYNFGGNGGISRICSNQYEDMWQNGFRHVFDQSGFIRNSSNGFDLVPDSSFDVTLRFKVGSFWSLDNGTTYICTDATEGAAEWELYSVGGIPTLQQVLTEDNQTGGIPIYSNDETTYLLVDNDGNIVLSSNFGGLKQIIISEDSFEFQSNLRYTFSGKGIIINTADDGFGLPRLTTTLMNDIPFPTEGMIVWNTTESSIYQFNGTIWEALTSDIPTTTSQLTNDGADGVNPFITALDIPVAGEASTLVREVKNMTGATLTKGTVVFISGANGNKALVSKALATTDALSARTFGLLQSDILNNGLGNCVVIGDLSGINTSSFAEGAQLYLSGVTAGAFTDVRTLAPTHLVYIGKVTRSHPTQGQIEVQIQNFPELEEIHDVQIVTPLNNQALVYETSSELWKNKTIIQDSITNGVTTVAPSQNAVFDALVNKKSIVIKDNVLSSIITLTSATEVLVKTYTIPAGTFVDGDIFSFILSAIKTGATQALNIRVKVNTVNNFATASQIALYTVTPFASTSIGIKRERIYFSGTNLTGANATTSLITDISLNSATNFSIALNPANEFFVFISLAGVSFTTDTGAINYFQITN